MNLIRDFESSYRKAWNDLHGSDFQELLEDEDKKPEPSGSGAKPKGMKKFIIFFPFFLGVLDYSYFKI